MEHDDVDDDEDYDNNIDNLEFIVVMRNWLAIIFLLSPVALQKVTFPYQMKENTKNNIKSNENAKKKHPRYRFTVPKIQKTNNNKKNEKKTLIV